jgi:hypothetical protein
MDRQYKWFDSFPFCNHKRRFKNELTENTLFVCILSFSSDKLSDQNAHCPRINDPLPLSIGSFLLHALSWFIVKMTLGNK